VQASRMVLSFMANFFGLGEMAQILLEMFRLSRPDAAGSALRIRKRAMNFLTSSTLIGDLVYKHYGIV
jgi:hypothetical protein